jgi:hypothetical protein
LILSGASGLITTALGIAMAFFPAQQVASIFSYEVCMFGGTFFFIYGRRKMARKLSEAVPVN